MMNKIKTWFKNWFKETVNFYGLMYHYGSYYR